MGGFPASAYSENSEGFAWKNQSFANCDVAESVLKL